MKTKDFDERLQKKITRAKRKSTLERKISLISSIALSIPMIIFTYYALEGLYRQSSDLLQKSREQIQVAQYLHNPF